MKSKDPSNPSCIARRMIQMMTVKVDLIARVPKMMMII